MTTFGRKRLPLDAPPLGPDDARVVSGTLVTHLEDAELYKECYEMSAEIDWSDNNLLMLLEYHLRSFNCNCDNAEEMAHEVVGIIREYTDNPQAYVFPDHFDEWRKTMAEHERKRQDSA